MESKPSIVLGNGGEIRLPVGFRFRPTDEELLVHYLKRKVLSVPLPARVIPELDVLRTNPWGLPGDMRERRHFFSKTTEKRHPNLHFKHRRAAFRELSGSGYWKLTGKEKRIVARGSKQVIGMRRNLVFREGENLSCAKSQWIMHELRLLSTQTASDSTHFRNETMPPAVENGEGEWAVYRVFQRRIKQPNSKKKNRIVSAPQPISQTPTEINFRNEVQDLMGRGSGSDPLPPPPPSPCSSLCTRDHGQEIPTAFDDFSS
ncbi:NAC domain-containing protein 83-like [Punica granatum]|uniref:NAC domain-containing protein n=2 Tax=Punica granatum TaxID=22663 RepID=A0A218WDZ3_PUNGR|nr:NAC domain-containing protein 83-like [Punica granatum]OWM70719.1 hypothetical protein CDL15_Pgr014392 [Punica granatum]PKI32877.1 hypothetical protein CRG98_046733 [Punica granatum]